MGHRIEIEIGRNSKKEGWSDVTRSRESYKEYECGLYTWFMVDDSITLGELFRHAEQHAKEVCLKRDDEFVDVMIHSIHQNYKRSDDTSLLEGDQNCGSVPCTHRVSTTLTTLPFYSKSGQILVIDGS